MRDTNLHILPVQISVYATDHHASLLHTNSWRTGGVGEEEIECGEVDTEWVWGTCSGGGLL